MLRGVQFALISAAFSFGLGCSRTQPDIALRMIGESPDFQTPSYLTVSREGAEKTCAAELKTNAPWLVLKDLGWLQPQQADQASGGRCEAYLTQQGQRQAVGWIDDAAYNVWRIPVATRLLRNITKITYQTDGRMAVVAFSYLWKLNTLGRKLFDEQPEQHAQFIMREREPGLWVFDGYGLAGLPQTIPGPMKKSILLEASIDR